MDFQERRALRIELRDIQQELREVFPPEAHLIRALPGGGLYIYINWEAIRDRLDEVVPDYELSFQQPVIDYGANMCVIVGTLTICGISKQALGSVPISDKSSSGKEMLRGDCVDRAHAETIKNCAEAWGVGRYLGDQSFCLEYLAKHKAAICEDYRNKLNVIRSQIQQKEKKGEVVSPWGTSSRDRVAPSESTDLVGAMNGNIKPKPKTAAAPRSQPKPNNRKNDPALENMINSCNDQQSAPRPEVVPPVADPLPPGLYPQHNGVINSAASIAGVSKGWIRDYLGRSREGLKPEHLTPEDLKLLLEAIAVQGYVAKYQDAKACRAAYRAKLAVLAPDGSGLDQVTEAFISFCGQADQLTAPVLSGGRSN